MGLGLGVLQKPLVSSRNPWGTQRYQYQNTTTPLDMSPFATVQLQDRTDQGQHHQVQARYTGTRCLRFVR